MFSARKRLIHTVRYRCAKFHNSNSRPIPAQATERSARRLFEHSSIGHLIGPFKFRSNRLGRLGPSARLPCNTKVLGQLGCPNTLASNTLRTARCSTDSSTVDPPNRPTVRAAVRPRVHAQRVRRTDQLPACGVRCWLHVKLVELSIL